MMEPGGRCRSRGAVALVWWLALAAASPALAEPGGDPRTVVWSLPLLDRSYADWDAGDTELQAAVTSWVSSADQALARGPYSVTNKAHLPPSGDIHDFTTFGIYYWPDPTKPDGLPWVFRDGEPNPEAKVDSNQFGDLADDLEILSLAYWFTGDERYAEHAAMLLRAWFLDPETKMNPHCEYGKIHPGDPTSGGFTVTGMAKWFPEVFDAAGLLEQSPHWLDKEVRQLEAWAMEFAAWMVKSEKGQTEARRKSNHGTGFDLDAAVLFGYAGERRSAQHWIRYFIEHRLPKQLAADGSQPLEMHRANNLRYHSYNLAFLVELAEIDLNLGDPVGLLQARNDAGAGIQTALEYLVPYLTGEPWPHFPGREHKVIKSAGYDLLRRCAVRYAEPRYLEAADDLSVDRSAESATLTHPRSAVTNPVDPASDRAPPRPTPAQKWKRYAGQTSEDGERGASSP